jgi:hypothetical protein
VKRREKSDVRLNRLANDNCNLDTGENERERERERGEEATKQQEQTSHNVAPVAH